MTDGLDRITAASGERCLPAHSFWWCTADIPEQAAASCDTHAVVSGEGR